MCYFPAVTGIIDSVLRGQLDKEPLFNLFVDKCWLIAFMCCFKYNLYLVVLHHEFKLLYEVNRFFRCQTNIKLKLSLLFVYIIPIQRSKSVIYHNWNNADEGKQSIPILFRFLVPNNVY